MGKIVPKKASRIYRHAGNIGSHIESVKNSLERLVFQSAKDEEQQRSRKRTLVSIVAVTLVLSLGAMLSKEGKAEVATFYPTACLGGWNNPHNAEGALETSDDSVSFAEKNSSLLPKDMLADLYCGAFKGEVPNRALPTRMTVTIAWKTLSDQDIAPIVGGSFASSSLDVLDATSSIGFTLSTTTDATTDPTTDATTTPNGSENAATTTESSPSVMPESNNATEMPNVTDQKADDTGEKSAPKEDTVQIVEPKEETPASGPQSLIHFIGTKVFAMFIDTVYALDETISSSTDPDDQSTSNEAIQSPVNVDATPSETQGEVQGSSSSSLEVIETASSTQDAIATTTEPVQSSTPADDHIFEILYTLDGQNWTSLGKVTSHDMIYNHFDIPLTSTSSWDDISNIQVKIRSIVTADKKPTVLVDGISLEVEYDNVDPNKPGEKADPKRYSVTINSISGQMEANIMVDADQGDILSVFTTTAGSLVVYRNATSDIVYSSGIGSSPVLVNSYTFDPGTFTAVVTTREDGCSSLNVDECSTDPKTIGVADFTIFATKDTPTQYVHSR